MNAVTRDNVLGPFWRALANLHRGVLVLNLNVLLAKAGESRSVHRDESIVVALQDLVRTSKTRLVILSDRPIEQALHTIPPTWPKEQLSVGGWRLGKGTVVLRAGLKNKTDVVKRVVRESVGIPTAYIGCDSYDEEVFAALTRSSVGILVGSDGAQTAAMVAMKSRLELLRFFEKWTIICGDSRAASV